MTREERDRRLDAVLRNSPTGLGWTVGRVVLTRADVRAYLEAIEAGRAYPHTALGAESASDRLVDRANALLRRAGLIHFDATARRWTPGAAGEGV